MRHKTEPSPCIRRRLPNRSVKSTMPARSLTNLDVDYVRFSMLVEDIVMRLRPFSSALLILLVGGCGQSAPGPAPVSRNSGPAQPQRPAQTESTSSTENERPSGDSPKSAATESTRPANGDKADKSLPTSRPTNGGDETESIEVLLAKADTAAQVDNYAEAIQIVEQ